MPRRALPMQMAPKSQTSGHYHKRKPKKAVGTNESGFVVHEGYFLCVVGLDVAEDWTVCDLCGGSVITRAVMAFAIAVRSRSSL